MNKFGVIPFKHVKEIFTNMTDEYTISIYTNDKNRLSLTFVEDCYNAYYEVNTLQLM